jgi:hypothetical protein
LVTVFAGLFVLVGLLACRKNGDKTNKIQVTAPSPELLNPNQRVQAVANENFEFNRQQAEVVVNSSTRIVEKELKEENSELKFHDYVSFPQFDGSLSSSQKKFNDVILQRAKREFESYKRRQLRPQSKAERFPRYHADVVEFLEVDYDLPFVTDKLVNVRFYASTYGRGAAHPVDYFFVFNFDLRSGREMTLADIFAPGSSYLRLVSDYSKQTAKERICREGGWAGTQPFEDCLKNAPLWEEGAKPTSGNFKTWTITKDGLLFSFAPCRLTGCAAGEFYVLVPYFKIKSVLKSDGPVSILAQLAS